MDDLYSQALASACQLNILSWLSGTSYAILNKGNPSRSFFRVYLSRFLGKTVIGAIHFGTVAVLEMNRP